MRRSAPPQGRRLLRVLLLRIGPVSPDPDQLIMLRHAEPPMTDQVDGMPRGADWTHGARACLTWGIPAVLLIISPVQYLVIVWPTLLTFMGVACLLNARRCGRIHCYFTGPFFLLIASVGLLYGLGVLPLGARGWSTLSVALVVGSAILLCVPEWILGRYRSSSSVSTPTC